MEPPQAQHLMQDYVFVLFFSSRSQRYGTSDARLRRHLCRKRQGCLPPRRGLPGPPIKFYEHRMTWLLLRNREPNTTQDAPLCVAVVGDPIGPAPSGAEASSRKKMSRNTSKATTSTLKSCAPQSLGNVWSSASAPDAEVQPMCTLYRN